jgi:hypothetical protein
MKDLIRVLLGSLALGLAGCGGDDADSDDDNDNDNDDGTSDADADADTDGDADADADGDSDADADGDADAQVCERWNDDRADLSEGTWSGNVGTCDAGDVTGGGRANALKLVNLYRWLAGLPPVVNDAGRDAMGQECALMMHANGQLSHSPPSSWTCYTADGASAAGNSNIASTAGVAGVDLYMVDPGNPTTIGHRRWILSNSLGPVGLGTTDSYSCMWVLGGSGSAGAQWTAWPSPGVFPVEAIAPTWWSSVDETGWTVQSDSISLSGAQVTVTADSQDKPVQVFGLSSGYGSSSAIRFTPQGWATQAGTTYHVEVTGISTPISYDVEVVSCQ